MFLDHSTFSLTPAASGRRLLPRIAWGVAALGLLGATVLQVREHGNGWLALGFALMPDLGLLAGIDRGLEKGQLAPKAVPIYNALHRFIGPALLALLALTGVAPMIWLSAALGWALHVAVDRTFGYGLRDENGFQRS
ncbi:MAG: DUF4260 family protein [Thermomicrobiales bacterium]